MLALQKNWTASTEEAYYWGGKKKVKQTGNWNIKVLKKKLGERRDTVRELVCFVSV